MTNTLVIALFPFAIPCSAQVSSFTDARWSLKGSAGNTDIGTFFSLGASKHAGDNFLELSAVFERSNLNRMNYRSAGIALTYNYHLASISTARLYAAAGTKVQREVVRRFLPAECKAFNAALAAGVELDVQLYDRIGIFGAAKQYFFSQKRLGRKRYDYAAGVKILFE